MDRFEQVDAIFADALDLPPAERSAFLDEACGDDQRLRAAVDRLLKAAETRGRTLVPGGALDLLDEQQVVDALRDEACLAAGARLGPYEIVALVGEGGMGQVYRARDTRLHREVALKVLEPQQTGTHAQRFGREARAASALNHPNIVTIYDVGTEGRVSYIAMEFIEGESLRDRLLRGLPTVDERIALAGQIVAGLAEAHAKGIVHRDLKPGNIMLTADGVAKIVDFGLAKIEPAGGDDATRTGHEPLTAEGMVFGTVGYMSPEQATGRALDYRSDLFSLGALLYELFTGKRAFRGNSDAEVVAAILKDEPLSIATLNPAVPQPLAWIVERCLQKAPEDRPSARDLERDLGTFARHRRHGDAALICGGCSAENPAGHRFCSQCGGELRRTCASCGEPITAEAGFCGKCGHACPPTSAVDAPASDPVASVEPTSSPSTLASERRQATVLAATMVGYERLVEDALPEEVERSLEAFQRAMRDGVERFGGLIDRVAANEVVALFGIPVAHEDDALRAVRSALAVRKALHRSVGERVAIGAAIHTGPVVVQRSTGPDGTRRVIGEAATTALGLAQVAEAGQVLVTPESRRLAGASLRSEPLAPVTLRAGGAAVTPELVSGADETSAPALAGLDVSLTEFAGRQSELGALMAAVESAVAGEGQFVTVVGEAGAGKSRLLYELRRQLDRSGVELLEGRCQSHGEGVPYLPLIQACRLALDVHEEDPPQLQLDKVVDRARSIDPALEGLLPLFLQLLAIPSDRYQLPDHLEGKPFRHAMQDALAALFTLASRLQPIVLLLEDWHWVDEASHDVVRQLVDMCPEYRLLVAVSYRPEASPEWSSAAEPRSIHLGALGPVSSLAIMRSVLEVQDVDDELARRVHGRTGGNPFFLEEVCRTLREEGVVEVESGRARIAGDRQALQLPESVQAVIRTRLDRIDPAARDLLRTASVIGREFSLDVLRRVVDEGLDLDAMLPVLKERGLVRQARVVPEPVFRFQHALTQEVAYDSLLQRQRKELHGRVGEAIEEIQRDTRDQDYDALARHFAVAEIWSKAVHYGQLAARRAQGLSQFADALNVLEHSREWLRKIPPSDETKELWITLLQEQARVSEVVGDLHRQQQAIDELLDLLADDPDRPERVLAHLGRAELLALSRDYDDSERALDEALAASRRLGQSELERDALRSLAFVLWQRQRNEDALDALDKALAIDRGRGATSQMVSDLTNRASVLRGLRRHEEALESLEEALRYADQPGGNPDRLVEALYVMYTVYRMMGETEKGEPYLRRALAVQSRRFTIHQPFQSSALANILVERGEVEDALALLRTSVEKSRQSRYAFGLSRCQLNLAQVLLGIGRDDEALPHLVEAAEIFAQLRDTDSEIQALAAAAPILEKGGDHEAARHSWERVREATRDGQPRVEACRGLGRLAATQGRWGSALVHLREAVELCAPLDSEPRGELLNEIGILEWKRGRYDEALDSYRQALAIYERSGEKVKAGVVLNSIGATLMRSGDVAEAAKTLERALTLHEETGQQLLRGHALALLGELALEAGDAPRARERFRESLELRKRTGDRRGEGWMRYQLARCHESSGQRDPALENLELARAIATEVGDEELADSCASLRLG